VLEIASVDDTELLELPAAAPAELAAEQWFDLGAAAPGAYARAVLNADTDPAVRHLLWEWGYALGNARRALGLDSAGLSHLADLGERLTADAVARCEAGQGELWELLELSTALGLGVRTQLVPIEELRHEYETEGRAGRIRRRRAAQALELPAAE
jgi:hypothetical protein